MPKELIGMIHLRALPTSPNNTDSIDEIVEFALKDLAALEKGGATKVIVENFFDIPYLTDINFEIYIAYTHIFTRIKECASIPLGVNIHSCYNSEEMVIASLCGADFIRAESFVETRHSMGGILKPMAAGLMRKKKFLSSEVSVFADVNVKESYPFSPQTIEEAVNDAIKAGADAIILTGIETGNAPSSKDANILKKLVGETQLIIGSGVNQENIADLLDYADGVIVGSSIKSDNKVENHVSEIKVRELSNLL
ncbi:BtpA/SgcQ family protein [Amphibacillus sp. Q70]|uniref:BtpA/SgcQ family protein n=1 Tax=Amphibacillus sp. Q70 TaxID=3453416 RepID=UPI003F8735FB